MFSMRLTFAQEPSDVFVLGEASHLVALGVQGQQRVHSAVVAGRSEDRVHLNGFSQA